MFFSASSVVTSLWRSLRSFEVRPSAHAASGYLQSLVWASIPSPSAAWSEPLAPTNSPTLALASASRTLRASSILTGSYRWRISSLSECSLNHTFFAFPSCLIRYSLYITSASFGLTLSGCLAMKCLKLRTWPEPPGPRRGGLLSLAPRPYLSLPPLSGLLPPLSHSGRP